MALQDILKKITDEANKKSAFMKQVMDDEIKKIEEESKVKQEERRQEIEAKGAQHAEKVVVKAKTLAVMQGRSILLKEKRELIDELYANALSSLLSADDAAYIDLVTSMLVRVMKDMKEGVLTVPAGKSAQTQKALSASKAPFEIKHESHDFKGGFILQHQKMEMNLTFEHVLTHLVRPDTELEVAANLFS